MKTRSPHRRHTAKIFATGGVTLTLLTAALLTAGPDTSLIALCAVGALTTTISIGILITSGHTIRWNHTYRHHGIWTATCQHCPGTHTRGPLQAVLRGARTHQHHHHP